MATVNIDDSLLERIEKVVEKKPIDYPSCKNFVDKTCQKQLREEEKDE